MGKDLKMRREGEATWGASIPNMPVQSPGTGAWLAWSRNGKKINVAGAAHKESSRGQDLKGKGGDRRDPVGPCKVF